MRFTVAVAAMVDCLVQHPEVVVPKGESYRLQGKREEVLTRGRSADLLSLQRAIPAQVWTHKLTGNRRL